MAIFISIFTTILLFINFSSSQIPIINLATNVSASIGANSSQNYNSGTNNSFINKSFFDAANNQSARTNNQSSTTSESGSTDNSPKIPVLPVQVRQDIESYEANEYPGDENFGENEEFDTENQAEIDTEGKLTIDEVLPPNVKSIEDGDEDSGTQEFGDKEKADDEKSPKSKTRSKNANKGKKSRRVEKLVCHAEIEIDPKEPIFAENFEKNFE